MSTFQIKESKYSCTTQIEKNLPSMEENKANIENLIYRLNQALVFGGRSMENYCVMLMSNYDNLKRVAQDVYRMNMKFDINNAQRSIPVNVEKSDKTSSSSSDDETSGSEYETKSHKRGHKTHTFKEKNESYQNPITYEETTKTIQTQEIQKQEIQRQTLSPPTNNKVISKKMVRFNKEFDQFSYEEVCRWLTMNEFEFIATNLSPKIVNGYQLRTMSDEEMEYILGLSSVYDRKKLRSTIQKYILESKQGADRLSTEWVGSWLEDIGLNQYKYEFVRKNINGNSLDTLRFKDIKELGIQNPLHQCSLKRSIQVLRQQEFHPCFLKSHANTNARRSLAFWTVADVASWLKNIKMVKKIKYIRNQGINGALMLLEPRFNHTSLIDVLKIKSKKNKRKIKAEFERLLPTQVAQEKDYQMKSNNYIPILKNKKDERKYADVLSSIQADDIQLVPPNIILDEKYKVPPALKICPVHQYNNSNQEDRIVTRTDSYI